jgi:hypothetical protein
MSALPHPPSIQNAPGATTKLGQARDQLAARLGLTPHEGRRLISTTTPLKAIKDVEESDLEALAVYFEGVYGLQAIRRPRPVESLGAWVSEIERIPPRAVEGEGSLGNA